MDKKVTKVVFLSRYSGTVNRGVETHVAELSKRLKSPLEITVLTGKDSDSLSKVLAGKFDIVVPTNGRLQALIMSLGRLIGGYKTVIAGHAGVGRDDLWNIMITIPDVFVALTDRELIWAKRWSWWSRVVKIPNGIDLKKFNPAGPKVKLDLENPVVLSVGALEWYKHHERTIEAVSKIDKASLLIIGTGSEQQNLEELAEAKLGHNRYKIMAVNYDLIPEYYRSADVFTLPSWDREAFGIVYLEAMASGLPVVAPDDSARREIVGSAGILTDVTDSDKFARSLERALMTKWGDGSRHQAGKFSWEEVADKYQQLFEGLIK